MEEIRRRSDFIHHQKSRILSVIREVVFGVQDGMISTLGVLAGIAAGTKSHSIVILSGFVVILVESISMGVGSYLSAKSVKEVNERKLKEEIIEIKEWPEAERKELVEMYTEDGWPLRLSKEMALVASKNKSLFLKEMAYRELNIYPGKLENPLHGGISMFFSYIIGGIIPVLPYFLFPIPSAIIISICITLLSLFIFGSITTKFTKRRWWKAGLEMFFVAGIAALVGYVVGVVANSFIIR